MHPFSILTVSIFVAGYITARWDLVTRLYELALFAVDHGVVVCSPRKTSSLSGRINNKQTDNLIRPGLPKDSPYSPFSSSSLFCLSSA